MSICGLDFGTSNTTLGTIEGNAPVLVALEADQTTIPSAIFYKADGTVLIGRKAIEAYVDGTPGRLMRSLKSVLGTSLIDETTRLGRERTSFRGVIAYYLGAVKRRAEQAAGLELRNVVHGRPVHFVDNAPDADRKAEETLRQIAQEIGFYRRLSSNSNRSPPLWIMNGRVTSEEVALIADIGGGTSDFRSCGLGPSVTARSTVPLTFSLMTACVSAGTDFDRQLSLGVVMPLFGYGSPMKRAGLDVPSSYFHDLATWSSINRMYEPRVDRRHPPGPARGPRAGAARPVDARRRRAARPYAGNRGRGRQDRVVRKNGRPTSPWNGSLPASAPPSAAPIWSATPNNWPSVSRPVSRIVSRRRI